MSGKRVAGVRPRPAARACRERLRDTLAETVGGRLTRIFALRLMLSIGVAALVSQALPLQRSYWVVLTVAIVLRPDFGSVFARALQRGIGTVVGAVLGAAILSIVPAGPLLLIPCAIFAGLLPYGRDRNWGLFSTFLTPLVVILIDLLVRTGWALALDRLIDTVLGCAIVLLVGYAPWPSSWHAHLPEQLATALDSVARYTELALTRAPGRSALRRQTYRVLSDLRTEFQRTMSEPPSVSRRAVRLWPALAAVEQLTDTVTAAAVRADVTGRRPGPPRRGAAGRRPCAPWPAASGTGGRRRTCRCRTVRTSASWRTASATSSGRSPATGSRRDLSVGKDWRSGARDMLVVVLTVTTGGVDAAAFLHLGHVFSSVITGTMVLLGVAAGTHDGVLAENCAVALASYVAGVAVGAPLAARRTGRWLEGWRGRRSHEATAQREIWPSWLTVALGLEFCVLAVFCVGWELSGGRPSGAGQLMLLANAGIAMGIQGATVRHLGEVSTTYLTGTLTGVIVGLVTGRKPRAWSAASASSRP